MKRLLAILTLVFGAPTLAADEVTIKLGTLAPSGSTWHNLLKDMGEKWSTASGGKVKLKIYPGGALGNEGDMVRKMAVGQLHAASITTIGLHDISPEPQALSVPMMIESDEEFDGEAMARALEALWTRLWQRALAGLKPAALAAEAA